MIRRPPTQTSNAAATATTQPPADPEPPAKKQRTRQVFSREVRNTVRNWLDAHEEDPYPSKNEKHHFSESLGLSFEQVSVLFNNERRRYKRGYFPDVS